MVLLPLNEANMEQVYTTQTITLNETLRVSIRKDFTPDGTKITVSFEDPINKIVDTVSPYQLAKLRDLFMGH